MSIPALIAMPASSCFASITLRCERVVAQSVSPFTKESQTFKWPGEQWMADFSMPPFKGREVADEWIAFGMKLQGIFNYFLLGDPTHATPRGVGTGSPKVSVASQTGNILQTKDWTPNVNGILKAGDHIQIGSGMTARLRMVVEDANSDASGNANLVIEPALPYSPPLNDPIVITNPKGLFRLAANTWGWSTAPGPFYRLEFAATEVVNA